MLILRFLTETNQRRGARYTMRMNKDTEATRHNPPKATAAKQDKVEAGFESLLTSIYRCAFGIAVTIAVSVPAVMLQDIPAGR